MIYTETTILCVAAGCGATITAELQGDRVHEAQSVSEAIRLQQTKTYRYVLLNADISTRAELDAKGADYIIVAPEPHKELEWTARWLKAGSSVESIKKRLARWAANGYFYDTGKAPLVLIPVDKWLSQMLEQDKAGASDGKDV